MIDRIYEAAAIPERWETVLHDLAVQHEFVGGVLFAANEFAQLAMSSRGVKAAFDIFIRDGWAARNERGRRAIARGDQGFGRASDLFTEAEQVVEPLYAEILRPFGLGDSAGTFVNCPNGDHVVLSFERALARGRTPETALRALDVLRPHIARAAVVSGRLDIERAKAQVSALGALGLPAAVTTSRGRVMAVNAGFEALSTLTRIGAFDMLSLHDRIANGQLSELFASPLAFRPMGRSIALRAGELRSAAVLHVLPVRRAAREVFSSAEWLLAVMPVGASSSPNAEILGALFDLTPTEARVTKALIAGQDLADIAQAHGVSVATVRNQLASIFAKTGVNRQTDLVLLCCSQAKV